MNKPGVGVSLIIINKEGKVLAGKRVKQQVYEIPGGHLERFESWEDCASRETLEETGLNIPNTEIRLVSVLNATDEKSAFHYVDICMVTRYDGQQKLVNVEPNKNAGWEWWSIEELEERQSELHPALIPFIKLIKENGLDIHSFLTP